MNVPELVPQVTLREGLVIAHIDPDALVRAIRAVHDGNVLLAPDAAASLRARSFGRDGWEIARALRVSEKTVKVHVSSVLAKLGVQDRTQAAVLATRHGIAW